jgi:membrane associated rhomboid family serine protease
VDNKDLRDGLSGFASSDGHRELLRTIAWMTPVIVAVNVAVFAVMAVSLNSLIGFNPVLLAFWGANSGALDQSGQWWRLLSYQFLHLSVIHLALNMWVMWSVGRLTERLYGSFALLFIYLVSGTLAGLASIVWNPNLVSVGASGSIFGVVGALLALFFRSRDEIPTSVLQYWLPISLFVVFNLFNGARQPGIDNAAHVGGLMAGICIGAVMVRPLESRKGFPITRTALASLLAAAAAVAPLWYLGAFQKHASALAEFTETHQWYLSKETPNLQLWQSLALQANAGTISNEDMAKRFETDILPFWIQANARLLPEAKNPEFNRNPFIIPVADFARIRLAWARAVIDAMRNASQQSYQAALDYGQQNDMAQARLDRVKLRISAETLPPPLAESPLAIWALRWTPWNAQHCVDPPPQVEKNVAPTDSPADGPAVERATGCEAQRLFLSGDYATLDGLMNRYSRQLSDLPDGSSHLQGILSGLADLFDYGNISITDALRRTADWRRTVGDTVDSEVVEAVIFRAWAYGARGRGYASTVSAQSQELFLVRSEMAAEDLRQVASRAADNPAWYEETISIGRGQAVPVEQLRAVFDKGAARFPDFLPLYRQMLTSLMPRWSGSIDQVGAFVDDVSKRLPGKQVDPAFYARLYLIYGELEGEDFNVVVDTKADPKILKAGFEKLLEEHPRSDFILNAVVRAECIDNEWAAYKALRPSLAHHVSATAWPNTVSLAICDKWGS